MGQAFSNDLRRRILRAYEREYLSQAAIAERFEVSRDYVKKIRQQQLRTGKMERPVQARHGPVSRVTPEIQKQIQGEVQQQPDVTLKELKERIGKAKGLSLSSSLLWLWLERLGLRRKKNRFMRKSETRKRTGSGVPNSWKRSARSRRNG
jgi:transposase